MNRIEELEHFISISQHPNNQRALGEMIQQVLADEEFLQMFPVSSVLVPADADENNAFPVNVCTSKNRTESNSPSFDPLVTEISSQEETALSKYSSKWIAKSIFHDQMEEDIFFRVLENLLDYSLSLLHPVTSREVSKISVESPQFMPIWETLVAQFGKELASKKVTDKIRTFGRNHRNKVSTS